MRSAHALLLFAPLALLALLALTACGSSGTHAGAGADASGSTGNGQDAAGSPGSSNDATAAGGGDDAGDPGSPVDASPGSDGASSASDGGIATAHEGGKPQCKRGVAANAAPTAAFMPSASGPGIAWWYDWATKPSANAAPIPFVPMIWGSGALDASIPAGSEYLLGFNEPNFTTQSNLTPTQAAADWPAVEAIAASQHLPIVSPAVNFCSPCSDPSVTDPYTWLKDFFAACSGCKVDYVAVHWYNCDLPSLEAYIEGNDAGLQGFVQFGKPIWLTEFSCNPSSTAAQQKTYMQAAVPYLENNPHVMKYAWFSADGIPTALLAAPDAGGALTELGQTYVGLAQSDCE